VIPTAAADCVCTELSLWGEVVDEVCGERVKVRMKIRDIRGGRSQVSNVAVGWWQAMPHEFSNQSEMAPEVHTAADHGITTHPCDVRSIPDRDTHAAADIEINSMDFVLAVNKRGTQKNT
jgi:hypothetical protein